MFVSQSGGVSSLGPSCPAAAVFLLRRRVPRPASRSGPGRPLFRETFEDATRPAVVSTHGPTQAVRLLGPAEWLVAGATRPDVVTRGSPASDTSKVRRSPIWGAASSAPTSGSQPVRRPYPHPYPPLPPLPPHPLPARSVDPPPPPLAFRRQLCYRGLEC